jgi:UDP:flavonoid glycosyltransferase YjiC (YdhE family)
MKLLLAAQTNSLSHLAKCLAIRQGLLVQGHEVVLAAGQRHLQFLQQQDISFTYLPSLNDGGGDGFPSIDWFMRPQKIRKILAAELELLQQVQPQRVLGVFRFTLKAAAQLAGIPYDSLICGCMLPEMEEGMGYLPGETGAEREHDFMTLFFRYAGARISQVLRTYGLAAIEDARNMLCGERTFLWDFPEFMPLPSRPGRYHVGPISWYDWPDQSHNTDIANHVDQDGPLAIMTFGTSVSSLPVARRIAQVLLGLGFKVILAAGGQPELLQAVDWGPRVLVCSFAPMSDLLPMASLLVCHGGQMTLFDALAQEVPTVVMPFQPEQAHNGVCLERLGCGRRLLPPTHFHGDSQVYLDSLAAQSDDHIAAVIESLVESSATQESLSAARNTLRRFTGIDALLPLLLGNAA